ncbi:LysR family transcriptional regulator [Labrys monachus]|uniref:DNA-binding transcriptional LysR family regulator n=1 Tax=Labrys monachus TaxID=217067 RepID=A0ABU0FP36_9HYPH|nr:LysR family transcriptional regulator [Labrys monachus]MDQ0396226.1 DNA-binding transcriptional LysR family regulator [Labrys monachus]
MTLEQLRIFVTVAEHEHLTRAAGMLHLTPSAVSSAVRVLEERYGATLFHRVGRRIELTDAAREFLPAARATLASAKAAELALSELGAGLRGSLTVQASQTIASYWVVPFLARYHDVHPAIDLRLEIGNTQSVAQAVLEGEADIGFIEGAIDEPALSSRVVAHDRLIVVVAPGHAWADGREIRAYDIATARWIMREAGSGTRSAFESALTARGVDAAALNVALVLPSNEAVRSAVRAGPYATVMSELVAGPDLQAGRLVRVGFDMPPRAFRLLRHKERYRTKASIMLEMAITQEGG